MGTSKVKFKPIRTRVLRTHDNVVPRLALALDHERSDDNMLRISPLDLCDLLEIDLRGPVGDEFNIIEPHHAPPPPIDRRIARTNIRDGRANRLPHRAAPTGIKRPHYLLAAICRRSRGKPERIQ